MTKTRIVIVGVVALLLPIATLVLGVWLGAAGYVTKAEHAALAGIGFLFVASIGFMALAGPLIWYVTHRGGLLVRVPLHEAERAPCSHNNAPCYFRRVCPICGAGRVRASDAERKTWSVP